MTEKNIFILSGPIHSGKTTGLINWSSKRNDVSGILTPIVNGRRVFMNAATKEIFPMEATADEPKAIPVGKYFFSATAFNRAQQILLDASNQTDGWLIIDEVGPLELKEEGFYDVLKKILAQNGFEANKEAATMQIVLVVRETLVDDVVKLFGIEQFQKFPL